MSENIELIYKKNWDINKFRKIFYRINDRLFYNQLEFFRRHWNTGEQIIEITLNGYEITSLAFDKKKHKIFFYHHTHAPLSVSFLENIIINNFADLYDSKIKDWNEGCWYKPKPEKYFSFFECELRGHQNVKEKKLIDAVEHFYQDGILRFGRIFKLFR